MTPNELKSLLQAATPGEWKPEEDHKGYMEIPGVIGCEGFYNCDGTDEPNAALIATLHNIAPLLLDLWEAVELRDDYLIGKAKHALNAAKGDI